MSGTVDSVTVDKSAAEGVEEQKNDRPEKSAIDTEKPKPPAADGAKKPKPPVADGAKKSEPPAADSAKKPEPPAADGAKKPKTSTAGDPEKPINKSLRYKEVIGDLFQCPDTSSLAHCVSKDLRMGKGIATSFKANFGRVDELVKQGKNVGECAVLQFDNRNIYYLITKKIYSHKPTYADFEASLVKMKEHCQANGVKELSMPQIGCGLDKLAWNRVSAIIKKVFADLDISITIYIYKKK